MGIVITGLRFFVVRFAASVVSTWSPHLSKKACVNDSSRFPACLFNHFNQVGLMSLEQGDQPNQPENSFFPNRKNPNEKTHEKPNQPKTVDRNRT